MVVVLLLLLTKLDYSTDEIILVLIEHSREK